MRNQSIVVHLQGTIPASTNLTLTSKMLNPGGLVRWDYIALINKTSAANFGAIEFINGTASIVLDKRALTANTAVHIEPRAVLPTDYLPQVTVTTGTAGDDVEAVFIGELVQPFDPSA